MIRLTLATILLALTAAAPAHASSYPGQRPVTAPVILDLVSRADALWNTRGVTNPACGNGPTVWEAPSLHDGDGIDAWGRGDGATCELWLSDDLINAIIDPPDAPGVALLNVTHACQAITHEDGHAHGLPHAPRGVMAGPGPWGAPDPEPHVLAWAPAFCVRFAREWVTGLLLDYGYPAAQIRATLQAIGHGPVNRTR